MKSFALRRLQNSAALILLSIIGLGVFSVVEISLLVQQYYSGWLLFFILTALLCFNLRKRLSMLPLGSASAWAQWHYYGGVFALVIFLKHVEFSLPNGAIEIAIAALMLLVATVGGVGLLINRIYAKRLTMLPEEIIYERISSLRSKLKNEVEHLLLETVEKTKSSTLAEYYLVELSDYFARNHNFVAHLLGSRSAHTKRVSRLEQQMRYLNQQEAELAVALIAQIERKSTLDNHFALQNALKYWGILHAPLGLVLAAMVMLHIVLVYAFRGAM